MRQKGNTDWFLLADFSEDLKMTSRRNRSIIITSSTKKGYFKSYIVAQQHVFCFIEMTVHFRLV